jgi:hypothetical protein
MVERRELDNLRALLTTREFPAWVGRLAGAAIIAVTILQDIVQIVRFATVSGTPPFWGFTAVSLTPLGIGFLLLVTSEILRKMSQR